MNQECAEDIPLSAFELDTTMFAYSLKRLKSKTQVKYELIIFKGGQAYLDALYYIFKTIWSSEKNPKGYNWTEIVQLFKGKQD